MFKTTSISRRILLAVQNAICQKRGVLSPAYYCDEAWNQRLQTELLQKINIRHMFNEFEARYSRMDIVNALDVDILANKVETEDYINEVVIMLEKLRLTVQTVNTLDSTHYAVIRLLLKLQKYETLLLILNDRIKYGIFPDHHCYNMMLNTFLAQKEYGKAAKVAVLPMLQEDRENEITNALCLYACIKYLDDKTVWPELKEEVDKDEKVVKVKVKYLRNEYFDNHFDLKKPDYLVGKSLIFFGQGTQGTMRRSLLLRGMLLFEKYEQLEKLLAGWKNSNDMENPTEVLFHSDIDFVKNHLQSTEKDLSNISDAINSIEKEGKIAFSKLEDIVYTNLVSKVKQYENDDINAACKKYTNWNELRVQELEKQKHFIEMQDTMKRIKEEKEDLAETEELLTYFDREEEIELNIIKKQKEQDEAVEKVRSMKRSARKLKKLTASHTYVAPELIEGVLGKPS